MRKVNRDKLDPHEWIIAESPNYYLLGCFEYADLISKKTNRFVATVGDFYGDVQDGIIDPQERFCVTVGCGYIVYFMGKHMRSYQYQKTTKQWFEAGRDPSNIHWFEHVKQLNDNEVELTDVDGEKTILDISKLMNR